MIFKTGFAMVGDRLMMTGFFMPSCNSVLELIEKGYNFNLQYQTNRLLN